MLYSMKRLVTLVLRGVIEINGYYYYYDCYYYHHYYCLLAGGAGAGLEALKLILKDLEERRFSHQSHIQLLGYKGKSVSFKHHNKLTLDGHEEVCSWYEAAERSPDEVQEGINCCDVGRGSSSVNVISCLRDSRLDGHHQDNAYIGWDCLEGCDDKITSTVFFFFSKITTTTVTECRGSVLTEDQLNRM